LSAGFGVVAAGIVLTAVAAFACTNLATLNLSNGSGPPGTQLTVTGSSFRVAKAPAVSNPVLLHWNGADGPVLAEVIPDSAGNISATFAIPEGQPGYYVIVATQRNAQGVDEYGTPARASFQILGPTGQPAVEVPGAQSATGVTSEPSSTGILALTIGLGVLGLALFGAGFTSLVRQARRREVPVTAPVRRD
jgi:hypothetical protein